MQTETHTQHGVHKHTEPYWVSMRNNAVKPIVRECLQSHSRVHILQAKADWLSATVETSTAVGPSQC